jgi:hypothetical protein
MPKHATPDDLSLLILYHLWPVDHQLGLQFSPIIYARFAPICLSEDTSFEKPDSACHGWIAFQPWDGESSQSNTGEEGIGFTHRSSALRPNEQAINA